MPSYNVELFDDKQVYKRRFTACFSDEFQTMHRVRRMSIYIPRANPETAPGKIDRYSRESSYYCSGGWTGSLLHERFADYMTFIERLVPYVQYFPKAAEVSIGKLPCASIRFKQPSDEPRASALIKRLFAYGVRYAWEGTEIAEGVLKYLDINGPMDPYDCFVLFLLGHYNARALTGHALWDFPRFIERDEWSALVWETDKRENEGTQILVPIAKRSRPSYYERSRSDEVSKLMQQMRDLPATPESYATLLTLFEQVR